jgi:hypothetical protein
MKAGWMLTALPLFPQVLLIFADNRDRLSEQAQQLN